MTARRNSATADVCRRPRSWFVRASVSASAALLCTAAAPAAAQTVTAVRHLDIEAVGETLYDSNVSHSSAELAEERGLSRSDVRFMPALTVDGYLPFGAANVSLTGSAGYDFYARNTRLNRERIDLDGVLGLHVSRCDTSLSGSYARRQSDLGDLVALDTAGPLARDIVNIEDITSVGASAICGGAVGLKPTVSVKQVWVDNSSDIRSISDYRSTSVSGGVAYARPSLGVLTLFGAYTTTDYPNRGEFGGIDLSDDNGFQTVGGGLRFERRIGSRWQGSIQVGFTHVDPSRDAVQKFTGVTYDVNLSGVLGPALQVKLDLSRAVNPSNTITASYYVERYYSADLTFRLTPRIDLTGDISYRARGYRGVIDVFGPTISQDHTFYVSGGGRYELTRRITLFVRAAREIRRANGTLFDYNSTQIDGGFQIKLDSGRR